LRPTANPLAGRVLIGVGLLLIMITVWEAAGHTGFHADQ
jgi:hypothetical protein